MVASNIKVFFRVRPSARPSKAVAVKQEEGLIEFVHEKDGEVNNSRTYYKFRFDGILPMKISQELSTLKLGEGAVCEWRGKSRPALRGYGRDQWHHLRVWSDWQWQNFHYHRRQDAPFFRGDADPPPPPGPPPAAPPVDPILAGIFANNPALAGNQFANPLLQANPLILATLANPAQPSAAIPQGAPAAEPEDSNLIDPDELCDYFHIEERHARRLNEIMKNRQETFVPDLERLLAGDFMIFSQYLWLYDVLERANSPAGLLVVKMREMEEGTFVGKVKADKD
eukprot:s1409_g15.t1